MNPELSPNNGRKSLIFLGIAVAVLILLCAVSFKQGIIGKRLRIDKAVICVEVDENKRPRKIRDVMQYGTKQVCLWFNYRNASEGNRLEVQWYHNDALIVSDAVKLMTKEGARIFYLMNKNGSSLPVGKYDVVINSPTKELYTLTFEVAEKNKDKKEKKQK